MHVYHSLYLLEDKPGKTLGHPSWVYKAISRVTGKNYTLIRVEGKWRESNTFKVESILTFSFAAGFRLVNEHAMTIVKEWKKIKHANIVTIREAFTTRAFGDSCKLKEKSYKSVP